MLQPFEGLSSSAGLLGDAKSFPSHGPKIRIDYIYASPTVRFTEARIRTVVASDHCPVIAEIEF